MDEQTLNAIKNNLANMAANSAPANAPSEQEEKGILDSMVDSVKGVFEDASNWMAERADYVDARDTVALEEYKRHKVSDNINAIANNNDSIFQPLGQAMQQSETVYKYIMDDSAKIAQARNIQKDIGIPVNVTLSDSTTWKRANAIYQENLENKKLSEDNGVQWSIYDIYKAHPEIKTITDSDPAAGALILKDMASARKEMNIIEGFTQYLNMGNKELELNNLRYKSYTAPSKMTDNDRQRMQDLEQQLDSEKKLYDVKFRDNPLLYALSGVGQSLPEMWQSIHTGLEDAAGWYQMSIWAGAGAGAAVGSVAGPAGAAAGATTGGTVAAITGAVKLAAKTITAHEVRQAVLKNMAAKSLAPNLSKQMMKGGMYVGSFRGMATPEIGNRFAEYQNLTDKNGISLMSTDEAWSKAFFAGSVNAALEVVPTGNVLSKMAKPGTVAEKIIGDIFAKNTAKAQLGADIGKGTQKLFVNTLKVTGTESFEEGTQQAADDLVKNQIKDSHGGNVYRKEHGDKYYDINLVSEGKSMTAREILEDSANAALAAVPSSMVFGLGGAIGGGAVSGGRYALRQQHLLKNETDAEKMARHTYTGVVMAEQLQDAVQNSELQKTAPDVQAQLIREKAKGTGFETIYIDTEMALKKENGQQDLVAVAKAAGIDEDALQTAVETKGTIAVPLESFAQSEASTELLESASFDTAADSMARMRENAKYTMEKMQENAERLVEQQMGLVESIPKELFPEDTEEAQAHREIVEAAILRDIDNPARGLNALISDVEANIMEILQPALNYLEDTSGNGVSIVDVGEGHTIRVSENAKWYQDFYKAHKRKPTKGELMDIAADMVGGKSNIEYWAVQNAEEAKAAAEVGAELERLNKKLDALNGVKEKMKGINSTEIKIAESMSPEGYKVYRKYADMLQGAPGLASRAARVNAVLFAHMMERLAENTRRATGNPNYTAMDAADKIMLQMGGRQANVNSLDQAMFDVSGKGVSSLNGFMLKILEKEAEGTKASKIKWFDKNTGVTYPGSQVKHAILKHDLTDEDLDNVQRGVNQLQDVHMSKRAVGDYHGKPIFAKTIVDDQMYYVSLEICKNGRVVFLTAARTNDKLYDTYKKEHRSESSTHKELNADSNDVLSIPNIQELMGIVKDGKENYSQMAGENAKTAALDKLSQAKEMLEAGEIESDIYEKTGWLRGFDGKWRFEIPDNLDKVDFTAFAEHDEVELGEIYDNPALYEAYPWLKEVSVAMEAMGKKRKGYADSLGISLNAALLKDKEKARENLATTLIHEIQHLIQKKEGFAAGGSPETVVNQVKNELKKVNEPLLKVNPSLIKQYWANREKLNELADDGNFGEEYEAVENQNEELLNSIAEGVGLGVEDTQHLLNRKRDLETALKKVKNASDKEKAEFELYQSLAGEREARYAEDRAVGKITGEPDAYEMQGYDAVIVFDGIGFNTPNQAMVSGIDVDQLVDVVDITNNLPDGKVTKKSILAYIRSLIAEDTKIKTADNKAIMSILPKDARHITYSSRKTIDAKETLNRSREIFSIKDLIAQSTLIERIPNTKKDRKPNVKSYYRFYVPVKIQDDIKTVRLVAEEQEGEIRTNPLSVNLYDVIEEKRRRTNAPAGISPVEEIESPSSRISIRDMLRGVKDYDGKLYIPEGETFNQIAWHGSPYDFDNFDLGAIGSGEGRQAHGWGLYFAKDKKVSEAYKEIIGSQKQTVIWNGKEYFFGEDEEFDWITDSPDNEKYKYGEAMGYVLDSLYEGMTKEEAIANLQHSIDKGRIRGKYIDEARKAITILKNGSGGAKNKPMLFKVDIPDNDNLLDENKRYEDQMKETQEKIVNAIKDLPQDQQRVFWWWWLRQEMGSTEGEIKANKELRNLELTIKYCKKASVGFEEPGKNTPAFLKRTSIKHLERAGYTEEQINNEAFMESESKRYDEELADLQEKAAEEKRKGKELRNKRLEDAMAAPQTELEKGIGTGKEIYDYLTKVLSDGKDARKTSEYLNEHGISGVTYDGGRDSRCYVVFDDKAISIIEKFNQGIKGQTSTTANGQYIVSLFEKADESTFMHEMAHMYLLELEKLAFMDEQCKKDFDTIMEWATYKNGDEKHYRKTPFAKEFGKIAADIRSAKKSGDKERAEKLKRQWAHERFARGFEMYLEHGTAPSKALQSAFRRFKQFLKTIYIAFTGDGARANAKVERVMARMLASDEEIEAMSLDDRYKDITKAGGEKLLNESQKETYQRWLQEAREEAKEKLMKIMMKDLEEENQRKYQEALDTERARKRAELEEQPLYVAQKIVEESGDKNTIVELNIYPSVEVYEAELKDKGTLQTNLEEYMKWYAESIDQQKVDTHTTQEKLEKMMEQSVYHKKLLAFEAAALREKEMLAQKINSKAKGAIDEVSDTIGNFKDGADEENVKKLVKAVNKLRFSSRWTAQELESIDNILKQSNKEEMKKALETFTKEATSWQQNLKTIEDAFKGRMSIVKGMARSNLMNRSIAESCDRTRYVVSEKKAASDMQRLIRAGKWDEAMLQQETRVTSAALAEVAEKNRAKVDKILDKVKKQLTAKTVKLPAEERYWINKLAYDLRLDKNWQKDLGRPTGDSLHLVPEEPTRPENCRELKEIFEELKNTLEVQEDMLDALSYIYQSGFTDYRALTMRQFEACTNIITVLYKTGRDKFQLKSFDGKLLSDVVDEIVNETDNEGRPIQTPEVNQKKINDDAGGIGYNDFFAKIPGLGPTISEYGSKYLTAHMKPEELIKLLGDKAHKYLYNLYDRAAGERGKRTAESIKKLQEIMSVYSRKEKQNMSKQVYELRTGAGVEKLSKENVICMALNMGTDKNFVRMYKGLGIDGLSTQRFIEANMTKKDWETVQKLWDYIGSFWPETVKVEEELNGVTPEGVEPRDFTIMCEGEPLKMKGGYYPIAYNPVKSTKAETQTMDAVTQGNMAGAQVLGTGRGFTKSRSETDNIERPLLLQFNVITNHLQDVIKNITFRIAARDAYRLTHAKGFEEYVRGTLGNEALKSINQWVIDCWRILPNDTDQGTSLFSRSLGFLRRNAAINIMGYKLWPVVENVTNLFPMMDRIGAVNTITALGDYMAHQKENDKLLLKSVFMTNRINSMDRDIGMMPGIFEAGYKATDWLKEHAYTALTFTDLMFSKPLWCRTYKDSFAKNFQDVLKEENQKKVNMDEAQQKIVDLQKRIMPLSKDLYAAQNELRDVMNDVASGRSNERSLIEKQNSVAQKESSLKPLRKELWEAELEVDRLSKIPAKTQAEITAEAEKRSAQEADAAVRSVFGSGETKDLAAVQKGGEFLKLFTAFYSFFNTQANAILASYYKGKFRRDELAGANGLRRWMPFAKSVFYRIILTSAMATVMKMALLGDGNDDKHKYRKVKNADGTEIEEEIPLLERFLTQFAKNTVSTASGTAVGLRDIVGLYSNLVFEGTDYGRGASIGSIGMSVIDKLTQAFKLASQQEEKNARIEEQELKRQARYDKMTPAAKKKFDENLKYRKPVHKTTYADIGKSLTQAVTSVTAGRTGITDSMGNAVMTTLQYMTDGDGCYDKTLSNMAWSAIWNKKPVAVEVPKKPPQEKKKKKGAK